MPPETVRRFFAADLEDGGDGVVRDQKFQRDAQRFFGPCGAPQRPAAPQTLGDAMDQFLGVEAGRTGLQLGAPIPGYSGSNRRIGADNLFGMTYAEARNAAQQSQQNIEQEKGTTNKFTSTFTPGYATGGRTQAP